jgi:hypothetical protein
MSTIEEQKIEELNKRKAPIVVIDESLDKYDNVILFPEKQAKYNEMLRAAGHPNGKIKHQKA